MLAQCVRTLRAMCRHVWARVVRYLQKRHVWGHLALGLEHARARRTSRSFHNVSRNSYYRTFTSLSLLTYLARVSETTMPSQRPLTEVLENHFIPRGSLREWSSPSLRCALVGRAGIARARRPRRGGAASWPSFAAVAVCGGVQECNIAARVEGRPRPAGRSGSREGVTSLTDGDCAAGPRGGLLLRLLPLATGPGGKKSFMLRLYV